jgi:hypothetical protein
VTGLCFRDFGGVIERDTLGFERAHNREHEYEILLYTRFSLFSDELIRVCRMK